MITVMASVMVVQAALIYQVQHKTSIAREYFSAGKIHSKLSADTYFPPDAAGIGAAAMLFIFQGAFTIGFQATVWVSYAIEGCKQPEVTPVYNPK